jgi:7-carboxy-7-deazaguanine synthase
MEINEIFFSIQGEGKKVGLPTIFIRTTGCNLRCSYCDTTYAYYEGKEMSIEEIVGAVKKYPCKRICLTGGEPLLQSEVVDLANALLDLGYELLVETNGSIAISNFLKKIKEENRRKLLISLDIKCPSSKMSDKMVFENIYYLSLDDQLKFVIDDREDYDYAKDVMRKYEPKCEVIFQPVGGINAKKIMEWALKDGIDVRIGIQLHKILSTR